MRERWAEFNINADTYNISLKSIFKIRFTTLWFILSKWNRLGYKPSELVSEAVNFFMLHLNCLIKKCRFNRIRTAPKHAQKTDNALSSNKDLNMHLNSDGCHKVCAKPIPKGSHITKSDLKSTPYLALLLKNLFTILTTHHFTPVYTILNHCSPSYTIVPHPKPQHTTDHHWVLEPSSGHYCHLKIGK